MPSTVDGKSRVHRRRYKERNAKPLGTPGPKNVAEKKKIKKTNGAGKRLKKKSAKGGWGGKGVEPGSRKMSNRNARKKKKQGPIEEKLESIKVKGNQMRACNGWASTH